MVSPYDFGFKPTFLIFYPILEGVFDPGLRSEDLIGVFDDRRFVFALTFILTSSADWFRFQGVVLCLGTGSNDFD